MPTRRRKIELHKLTISGIGNRADYAAYLSRIRQAIPSLGRAVMESNAKSHALYAVELAGADMRLRFMSYTTGHRPDILDTEDFSVERNPLPPNTTGIEWTHALGRRVGDQSILAIERYQAAIWPTTIERYLQWMIDESGHNPQGENAVTVSLEAVPGQRFIERLDALQRVTKATVRTVRPNPGWTNLQNELADQSARSDSHKTDVTMTARRNGALRRDSGMIAAIKRLFRDRQLDYAAIEGKRNGEHETFNTQRLGKSQYLTLQLDEQGQVRHSDAWNKLAAVMDHQE